MAMLVATVQGSIDSILAERAKVDTTQMQLETGESLNRSQLRFHLLSKLLRALGEELKIEVTKAEIDTRRASIIEQVGGTTSLPNALVSAGIAPAAISAWLILSENEIASMYTSRSAGAIRNR